MSAHVLDPHSFAAPVRDLLAVPEKERRPFSISFISALAFHAILLFFGGMIFVRPPEYGIDLGRGGMEIYLVAAPVNGIPDPFPSRQTLPQEKSSALEDNRNAEMALPFSQKTNRAKKIKALEKGASVPAEKNSHSHGDGSSPVAGQDPTTFYSPGGAWMEAKAGHLRNPAPPYPQTAIERGQEGLVVISALVNPEGRPGRVEIKQSSGFPLLDQSALAAIKKWKFNPGRAGLLAHEAWVTIPVRFRLEDAEYSS